MGFGEVPSLKLGGVSGYAVKIPFSDKVSLSHSDIVASLHTGSKVSPFVGNFGFNSHVSSFLFFFLVILFCGVIQRI